MMKSNYQDLTDLKIISAKVDILDFENNKAFLTLCVQLKTTKSILSSAPVELKFAIDSSDALFGHIDILTRQILGKEREV
tara:strand:+ start:3063 stop:3302 length:240 start_codon:yes stop_codon:yes gene_type:complete